MTLADARESAKKILGGVQLGVDPGAKKKEFRKSATFEELSKDFLENYARLNKKESSVHFASFTANRLHSRIHDLA